MTVASTFYNWQTADLEPGAGRYSTCSPNLSSLSRHLVATWGGQSLGCFGVRPIKGTSVISSHSFGAALDWRYENPGPGRDVLEREILPWLINNSAELGLQAIHDYFGCRIWRAYRATDANEGWKKQTPSGTGMGQAWARYLHLEVPPTTWADGRPVTDRLDGQDEVPPTPPGPAFDPANGRFGTWPSRPKPAIRLGDDGVSVKYAQGVLRKARYTLEVDGWYGAQTQDRVRRFQRREKLPVTGIIDQTTWRRLDAVAER